MHTRKGGTLRFTQQQLNQRVGYTELIMVEKSLNIYYYKKKMFKNI
jgi:hypothetical protein